MILETEFIDPPFRRIKANFESDAFVSKETNGAAYDADQKYRYSLWRRFDDDFIPMAEMVAFCALNPSTATAFQDDPTIRREIQFAKDWGFRGLLKVNLFGWRSTDPAAMKAVDDPIGPENDRAIRFAALNCGLFVCCWGVNGAHRDRGTAVRSMIQDLAVPVYHLGLTKDGLPKHPLYLRADTQPIAWKT